jgi:hypothetical protein
MAKTVAHRAADDGMGSSWRDGPVRRVGGHCVTPRPVPPPKVLTAADTSSEDADWQLRAPAGDDDSGTGGDEDDELEAPLRVTRGRGGAKGGLLGDEGAHMPIIMDLAPDGSVQAAIPGKRCGSCGAITTPLWRHGPDGPKTLCNACGVRDNRKKGRIQPPRNGKVSKPPSSSKAAGGEGGAAVVPSPRPQPRQQQGRTGAGLPGSKTGVGLGAALPQGQGHGAGKAPSQPQLQQWGGQGVAPGSGGQKRRHPELVSLGIPVPCASPGGGGGGRDEAGPSWASAGAHGRSRGLGASAPGGLGTSAARQAAAGGGGGGQACAPGGSGHIPTPQCNLVPGYEVLYPKGFALPPQLIRAKSGPQRLWGPGPTAAPLYCATVDDTRWLAHANAGCNPGGAVTGSAAPAQLLTQRQLERCIDLCEMGSWEAGRVLSCTEAQQLLLVRHGDWASPGGEGAEPAGASAPPVSPAGGAGHASSRRVTGAPPPGGCGAPSPAAVSAAHAHWLRRRAANSPDDPSIGLLGSRFAIPPPLLRRRPEDASPGQQLEYAFVFNAAAVARQRAESANAAARRGGGAASAAASRKRRRKDAEIWGGTHKKRKRVQGGAERQRGGEESGDGEGPVRRRLSPLEMPLRFAPLAPPPPPPPPPLVARGHVAGGGSRRGGAGDVSHLWSGPQPPRNTPASTISLPARCRHIRSVPGRQRARVPVLGIFSAMGCKLGPSGKPIAKWGATRAGGTTPQVCHPTVAAVVDAAETWAAAKAYAEAMQAAVETAQQLVPGAKKPTGGAAGGAGCASRSPWGGGGGMLSGMLSGMRRAVSHA